MSINKAFSRILCAFLFALTGVLPLSAQEDSFEFVVLPDTQTYVEEYPEIYLAQMEWLARNKDRFSFVIHVGDITQNNNQQEWEVAKKGFKILDGELPYSFALGNHDMGSEAGKFADVRNTSLANKYFSPGDLANIVETYPEGTVDNLLQKFTTGKPNWMILSLEFGPRNKTVDWANKLIKKYPDYNFIISTHAYLYENSTHHDEDEWWQPKDYGIGEATGENTTNNGKQLWEKLVKKHENVKMVFSGHILKSGVGTLVSTGDNGNKVYQMLANYQKGVEGSTKGGNGFLRIIKVDAAKRRIGVSTYSPVLDEFKKEKAHSFIFKNVEIIE